MRRLNSQGRKLQRILTAMDVEIRAASECDLASVLQVYDEAAAWLQSIGITEQWGALLL